MPISAAGSKSPPPRPARRLRRRNDAGFTLIELLVVVALIAIGTAVASLAVRNSDRTELEREGQRLAAVLESLRAQARANHVPVAVEILPEGLVIHGLTAEPETRPWLSKQTTVDGMLPVAVGPEPLIPARTLVLKSASEPTLEIQVATDGLRPWAMGRNPEPTP